MVDWTEVDLLSKDCETVYKNLNTQVWVERGSTDAKYRKRTVDMMNRK